MDAQRLSVRAVAFADFAEEIRLACRASPGWKVPEQIDYIVSYLTDGDWKAKSIVVEDPYVDRHYLEEYSAYYATLLRAQRHHAARIHIFEHPPDWVWSNLTLTSDAERVGVEAEAEAKFKTHESALKEAYLGFVTVRPIPSAPIGRSVLRPWKKVNSRVFGPDSEHRVHLAGFELVAPGMPFQQQEQAVGACATTALWSALSRTIRSDGGRSPTPHAVTVAATKHLLNDRVVPAVAGLELAQMTDAIRELGCSPYVLKPRGSFEAFLFSLTCYLRSGIPAVLMVDDKGPPQMVHAVAVSGFRESDEENPAPNIIVDLDQGRLLRTKGVTRVYVHDDRLGPYVRMKISPGDETDDRPLLERVDPGPKELRPGSSASTMQCFPSIQSFA